MHGEAREGFEGNIGRAQAQGQREEHGAQADDNQVSPPPVFMPSADKKRVRQKPTREKNSMEKKIIARKATIARKLGHVTKKG